jgi:hypothetical protein
VAHSNKLASLVLTQSPEIASFPGSALLQYYWNEPYKRTLKKVVLMSRTLRLVHREAEASMIATPLLLCQGALAMPAPRKDSLPVMCSPRGVLLEVRRDIMAVKTPRRPFSERIARAQREQRVRTSAKQKREWPRRKPHTAPHPPLLLRLTEAQKIKIHEHLQAA